VVAIDWVANRACDAVLRTIAGAGEPASSEVSAVPTSTPDQCTNRHVNHGENTATVSNSSPTSRSDNAVVNDCSAGGCQVLCVSA
jgi:hypothetical protein